MRVDNNNDTGNHNYGARYDLYYNGVNLNDYATRVIVDFSDLDTYGTPVHWPNRLVTTLRRFVASCRSRFQSMGRT